MLQTDELKFLHVHSRYEKWWVCYKTDKLQLLCFNKYEFINSITIYTSDSIKLKSKSLNRKASKGVLMVEKEWVGAREHLTFPLVHHRKKIKELFSIEAAGQTWPARLKKQCVRLWK